MAVRSTVAGFDHRRESSFEPPPRPRTKGNRLIWVGAMTLAVLAGINCAKKTSYLEMPLDYRHKNVKGIEALFLDHLNRYPEDRQKLVRILSNADEALNRQRLLTRRQVIKWIDRQLRAENFDHEKSPGIFFLHSVYLEGWDREFFNFLDEEEREMLNDLITGVMGALHNCHPCATSHRHGETSD